MFFLNLWNVLVCMFVDVMGGCMVVCRCCFSLCRCCFVFVYVLGWFGFV